VREDDKNMTNIPFDDRDGSLWYDGRLVPWRDAKTHVLTHGLHYGSSVFEGLRMYSGRIFKLREHTQRLFASAAILGMKIPYTEDEIDAACYEAARALNLTECYLRPVAFRGSEFMAISAAKATIHVAVAAWQWPHFFDPKVQLRGIRLDLAQWRRPPPETIPCRAKAAGLYMICTLAKHAAEAKGYADAMMLDYRGLVAEATGANMFFVKDGQLFTPTPDCFLDGITRKTVMELARKRNIPVIERAIEVNELEGFEECFMTGTGAEVAPVSEIAQFNFQAGRITETLMNDYMSEVRRDTDLQPISASA
jgi:branched-chain amino acid aminotransferase